MSNTITVHGNLGRDAELKHTPSGAPVLEFSLADTPRRKNDRGEWEDAGETTWYRASVWGPLAEALANASLAVKGAQAAVTGTLTQRTYEKDGRQRASLDIRVDTVGFREKRGAGRHAPATAQGAARDPWAADGRTSEEPPW